MKKYVLCPGYVTSRTDGDRHYIGVSELLWLYGVSMNDCLIDDTSHSRLEGYGDLVRLYPKSNGDYRLPQAAINASVRTADPLPPGTQHNARDAQPPQL